MGRAIPTRMVLLLNGATDLSLLILCFLWGSSWCVAVLMIFKSLFRGKNGKLNCHLGRILQETKFCIKKIHEVQMWSVGSNISHVLLVEVCLGSAISVLFITFSLLKLAKNGSQICLSFSRTSLGSVLPAPSPECVLACSFIQKW